MLQLLPAADFPIGEYQGNLGIAGQTLGVTIPFTIKNVSAAVGDLKLTIVDERAYYGENPTNLAGASIIVRDPFNNDPVASGQSGTNGEFLATGIREGTYNFEITAPKHDTTSGTLQILPGQLIDKIVFLRTRLVTYKWTVEEIEIEDRTKITLESVYETTVPVPVVTVEPNLIDLDQVQGNQAQIDMKISNQGLVAANDVKLNFDSHPLWSIKPLISDIGVLPAKSSLIVPVIIERINPAQTLSANGPAASTKKVALASAPPGPIAPASFWGPFPCGFGARVEWTLVCGPMNIAYPGPPCLSLPAVDPVATGATAPD